ALLALLSQKSEFPALMLLITVVALAALFGISFKWTALVFGVLCAVFAVMTALAQLGWVAGVAALLSILALFAWNRERLQNQFDVDPNAPSLSHTTLQQQFKTWVAHRSSDIGKHTKDDPYPVFIVAVEGGGIYAAVAAALFLSKVQSDQPDFVEHLFAISAVSGGAIGASIFQALHLGSARSTAAASEDCADFMKEYLPKTDPPLLKKVAKVMLDDHFSPIVGAIVPDFLGE